MTCAELQRVLDWTKAKLATGEEPPWAWYQYMKLCETLEAILAGMDSATTESSPQLQQRSGRHLQLVDSTCQRDTAPPRPSDEPVQMPM